MSMPIVAWSKAVGRGGAGDDCDAASSGAVQCGGRRRARSTSPPAWRRPGTAMEVKHQRRCGLRRIARVMCSRASAVLRRQLGRRVLCATAAGAKSAVCDGSRGEECCVRRQLGRRVLCATLVQPHGQQRVPRGGRMSVARHQAGFMEKRTKMWEYIQHTARRGSARHGAVAETHHIPRPHRCSQGDEDPEEERRGVGAAGYLRMQPQSQQPGGAPVPGQLEGLCEVLAQRVLQHVT